jgi:hypothetical protein
MNTELEIFLAVFSGFMTALVIEVVKGVIDRKKTQEARKHDRYKRLHAFMENDENHAKRNPVARLLISTPRKAIPIEKISKKCSREIRSVCEIKNKIIPFEEIYGEEKSTFLRKLVFWKKALPKVEYPVYRTYYKKIEGREDYAFSWETRDRVELLGRVTTVGRSNWNDVVLPSTFVSRQHAVIRFEKECFVLYNLAITNPIEINDEEIGYRKELRDGDVIELLGSYLIEFQQRDS